MWRRVRVLRGLSPKYGLGACKGQALSRFSSIFSVWWRFCRFFERLAAEGFISRGPWQRRGNKRSLLAAVGVESEPLADSRRPSGLWELRFIWQGMLGSSYGPCGPRKALTRRCIWLDFVTRCLGAHRLRRLGSRGGQGVGHPGAPAAGPPGGCSQHTAGGAALGAVGRLRPGAAVHERLQRAPGGFVRHRVAEQLPRAGTPELRAPAQPRFAAWRGARGAGGGVGALMSTSMGPIGVYRARRGRSKHLEGRCRAL